MKHCHSLPARRALGLMPVFLAATFLTLVASPPALAAEKTRLRVDDYQIDVELLPQSHKLTAHATVKVTALENIFGIDPVSFRAVSGGFVFYEGHDLQGPDDILIDDIYSKGRKVKLGQTLHILGHDFHVAGIVEHGKGARLFVLMSTLQEMVGTPDKASVFFVKCDRSDHTGAVMDEIRGLLPRYEVRPRTGPRKVQEFDL